MQAMIPFPDISPEIFSIPLFGFNLALRWYALAYIAGIIFAWRITVHAAKRATLWKNGAAPMTATQIEDLLTWVIIGIILGGRLGFVLFYQPAYYLANPDQILMVWQGGMAFHGGFLGVVIATFVFLRRQNIPILPAADAVALGVPTGLFLVRLANFIKPELWGRPTDVPWAVAFPGEAAQTCANVTGVCARHPSQLYEAALEGIVLLAVLLFLAYRRGALKKPGQITGVFLAGYGIARFIVEFYRQADEQFITLANPMGYIVQIGPLGITMGQLLSLPMLAVGLLLILYARRSSRHASP